MTLESSKTLGGIGAILLFVGGVAFLIQPLITLALGFVGALLLLFGLKGLADYYKEKGIFINGLYGFVTLIVGAVVSLAGFVYLFFYTSYVTDLVAVLYPGFTGDWSTLPNLTVNPNPIAADIVPFIGPILAILVVIWIFVFVVAFFTWRSLKGVASKSNVGLFSTAGLLLLVGAIIPVLGLILMGIAVLLMAIAFFQIKPQPEQPMAAVAPPLLTPV
jgi:uncharacterized membrane protein